LRRRLVTSLLPALVIALAWLRLESPHDTSGPVFAILVLALVPLVWQPLVLVSAVLMTRVAFGEWPRHLGRVGGDFRRGFLDFYDVKTPFDPRVHTEMRGVVLTAIFGFVLLLAFALSRGWTPAAVGAVLLGAGWPATLGPAVHAGRLGLAILLSALIVLAGVTRRRLPRSALPAFALVLLAAVAVTASSAVAQGGLVAWQEWDFYTAPVKPVSVGFVWDADYSGITFPRKRTTVLQVDAPPRSLFWRAAVLDVFEDDHWVESTPRPGDALEPVSKSTPLLRQRVHVLALQDTRLVGASEPIRFDAGDAPVVDIAPGFARLPSGLTRGLTYDVESYAPKPTAAQLEHAPARYPQALTEFRRVGSTAVAPLWGARRGPLIDDHPALAAYAPLLQAALRVTAHAHSPYAAVTALVRWFRVSGGFRYTNHPAETSAPPLVGFVAQTRAGYCQQFAGAMALMLRYLGVPARVAVGFSSGRYDAKHHRWIVTDHDAHAWVEAWFRGYGWLPFDPTPSLGRPERGELSAPYARTSVGTLSGAAGVAALNGGRNDRSDPKRHGESNPSTAKTGRSAARPHGGHVNLILLLLLVCAAVGVVIVLAKLLARRVRYATRDPRRLAAACRRELADFLLDQRIEGARSATLHELGALVRGELSVEPDAFVAAATAARFGPPIGADAAARDARRELRRLLRQIRSRLEPHERVRGVLSLRSLGLAE
jgi:transglutaminase-like putative cysteine protease